MVEREVEAWRLLSHAKGTNVLGPTRAKKPPDVLLASCFSPAKSASTYKCSSRSSGWSPTVAAKR